MPEYKIERVGGFAGYGTPGSHIASRGRINSDDLDETARKAVEALFARYGKGGQRVPPSPSRDAFSYRISRAIGGGEETIEVPEAEVPAPLIQSVKDELI